MKPDTIEKVKAELQHLGTSADPKVCAEIARLLAFYPQFRDLGERQA